MGQIVIFMYIMMVLMLYFYLAPMSIDFIGNLYISTYYEFDQTIYKLDVNKYI